MNALKWDRNVIRVFQVYKERNGLKPVNQTNDNNDNNTRMAALIAHQDTLGSKPSRL